MDCTSSFSTVCSSLKFAYKGEPVSPPRLLTFFYCASGFKVQLSKNERDARFKMFTLATLSSLVAGNKIIPMLSAAVFSQELFVVFLTMPITMFYYNHFLREYSLKKSTLFAPQLRMH